MVLLLGWPNPLRFQFGLHRRGTYFGEAPADTVTLRYRSWTDTKIVINGFSGSYGTACSKVQPGDPVAVSLWNTNDRVETGPQTAKRGLILYGIPGN